ncbi:hypothetical protein PX554_03415 [Sphingomonas sp. H39-1-10]|uniref:hypothetical protein n=1 Tax=Sphingomonas pollutisoli TaxID=3030829 RepID=UPI0023B93DCD|nr:hypothetical protein [Sphingomonas pollutisoli]MDF0487167.1 hypothetical protein [Sphingomonas pollutisoli]
MKNRRALAVPALLLATSLAGGCAEQTVSRYPSLQPRAIERRSDAEAAAAAPAPPAPDPALDATLATTAKTLADTDAAFGPAADGAERAARAARGGGVGSDRWIAAQTALAKLDAFRATTSASVTDLDELAIGRARDAKPPYPALESLKARGDAQLTAEINRIAAIQALLPAA